MRPFTARRLALAALVPALLVLSVIPGCSNQSEGERCTDDSDCDSALTCTASAKLQSNSDATDRCCYASGRVTDSRCAGVGSSSATGSAGAASSAGASSTAGSTSADAGAAGQAMSEVAGAAGGI